MVWLSTWSLTQKETPLSAPCNHVLRKHVIPETHRATSPRRAAHKLRPAGEWFGGNPVVPSRGFFRSPQLQVVQLDEARMRYSLAKVEADKLLFEEHAVRRAIGEAEAALVPIEQQARASAHRVSGDWRCLRCQLCRVPPSMRRCGGLSSATHRRSAKVPSVRRIR